MLRKSRSSNGMGLLDGLQSLQGPPPPRTSTPLDSAANTASDAMSQFSSGAKSIFGDLGSTLNGSMDNLGGNVKSSVNSFRRMMGDESVEDLEANQPPAQMTLSDEMNAMFNLSMFQRLALFAMIFGTGVLMICISFSFLPLIVVMPHKFAASFTLGNILAIVSTWVLVGPKAQLQAMFAPVRAIAAGIYVASLFVALFAAFFGGKLRYIFVLIALVAEIASRKSIPSVFFIVFTPYMSDIDFA